MGNGGVVGVFVYPVKSFGGISLGRSGVGARGLEYDRRWMLVDGDGVFMTQRSDTRLALFRTELCSEGLWIREPGGAGVLVPFVPLGRGCTVRVWNDVCEAVRVGDEVDEWFSSVLGQPCSLVYMPDESVRATNPLYTQPGDMVGFADSMPVLVVGESSLADLNSRLAEPLPLNRFRGNVIVRGWEPFAEDGWDRLQIGDVVLRAAKQCGRCSVTATDQETGVVGVEPLRTLAGFRRFGKAVMFGAYYVPEVFGTISVGDSVVVGGLPG